MRSSATVTDAVRGRRVDGSKFDLASEQGLMDLFGSEFSRIKEKRFYDTEEVRHDVDLQNGVSYTGVAPDGTPISNAVWTIIRTDFDANRRPIRERIRFDKAWNARAQGWS